MKKLKIVSYNVNGVRAALKKDLLAWLDTEKPDVFCMQETKAQSDQVDPEVFKALGYEYQYWHSAEKKGYSGVATFSKVKADKVVEGMKIKKYDIEGRMLRTDFGDITLLNCYFPSGSASELRHEFKIEFLHDLKPWVDKLLKKRKNVVLVGDYNVIHQDIDIHNPKKNDKRSGCRPAEREWMKEWFEGDFIDAFRQIHGDVEEHFTWWSFRAGSRQRNKGWRIDYISASKALKERILDANQHKDAMHSDHCPTSVVLGMK